MYEKASAAVFETGLQLALRNDQYVCVLRLPLSMRHSQGSFSRGLVPSYADGRFFCRETKTCLYSTYARNSRADGPYRFIPGPRCCLPLVRPSAVWSPHPSTVHVSCFPAYALLQFGSPRTFSPPLMVCSLCPLRPGFMVMLSPTTGAGGFRQVRFGEIIQQVGL